jgi:hypothetical protein
VREKLKVVSNPVGELEIVWDSRVWALPSGEHPVSDLWPGHPEIAHLFVERFGGEYGVCTFEREFEVSRTPA